MDEILRWLVGSGLVVIIVVGWVGGTLTPVAGRWLDDERTIVLRQWGPFVRGSCPREGGEELYKGLALFGFVRLMRFVFGPRHLVDMGFAPDVVPLLDGRPMAAFRFRLSKKKLRGIFEGRKFSFEYEPARITSIARLEPTERIWTRRTE